MQVQPVRRRRIIISCNICQTPTVYINTIYNIHTYIILYCSHKKAKTREKRFTVPEKALRVCVCVWVGLGKCECMCGCNIDKSAFIIHSKSHGGAEGLHQ